MRAVIRDYIFMKDSKRKPVMMETTSCPQTPQSVLTKSYPGVGSSNNYAYLVVDDASKDAFIIDPAHPEEYVTNTMKRG